MLVVVVVVVVVEVVVEVVVVVVGASVVVVGASVVVVVVLFFLFFLFLFLFLRPRASSPVLSVGAVVWANAIPAKKSGKSFIIEFLFYSCDSQDWCVQENRFPHFYRAGVRAAVARAPPENSRTAKMRTANFNGGLRCILSELKNCRQFPKKKCILRKKKLFIVVN